MNILERAKRWVEENMDPRCPYCRWRGACAPECQTRKCPECGGLGVVIDLAQPLGVSDDDGVLYGGKPCPRGCPAP